MSLRLVDLAQVLAHVIVGLNYDIFSLGWACQGTHSCTI